MTAVKTKEIKVRLPKATLSYLKSVSEFSGVSVEKCIAVFLAAATVDAEKELPVIPQPSSVTLG